MDLELPGSAGFPRAASVSATEAWPAGPRFAAGELRAPPEESVTPDAPQLGEEPVPSRYPGARVVAMVQDPGTLWVAWEGLPADGADDGWSLEVLGPEDEVLSSALVPYGARGAYMRVDVRFARRVRVGSLRSATASAGPVLPAGFDAPPASVPREGEAGPVVPEASAPPSVEGVVLPLRFATTDAPAASLGSGSVSLAYAFEPDAADLPGSGSRPL